MSFASRGANTTPFDDDPLSFRYDARFEFVTQDAAGISLWPGPSIEPAPALVGAHQRISC